MNDASYKSGPHQTSTEPGWAALEHELEWLQNRIMQTVQQHLEAPEIADAGFPPVVEQNSRLGRVLAAFGLDPAERLILSVALAAALRPGVFDPLQIRNSALDRPYPAFGGVVGPAGVFCPTARTAAFLLGGTAIEAPADVLTRLGDASPLVRNRLVEVQEGNSSGSLMDKPLIATNRLVERLMTGEARQVPFGANFPAQRLSSKLGWDDLVLAPATRRGINEVRTWMKARADFAADPHLSRWLGGGYSCLFYGPPGTGKTQTASILGQELGLDVYRIDLSMVVSKWIGETEKNLSLVFDEAEDRNWILFFDEADALFGKRTTGSSANDRFANQEVSYLLQRFERFEGLAILATNLRNNMDEAFSRRFQSVLHFPMPNPTERLALFQKIFGGRSVQLAPDVDFALLAESHEVTGAMIVNVLRYAVLAARARADAGQGDGAIRLADIRQGISREYHKEGRVL